MSLGAGICGSALKARKEAPTLPSLVRVNICHDGLHAEAQVINFGIGAGEVFFDVSQVLRCMPAPHFGRGERHADGVKVRTHLGPSSVEYHLGHGGDIFRIRLTRQAVTPRVLG